MNDREGDEAEHEDGDGDVQERDPHPVQRRHELRWRKTLFRPSVGVGHTPDGQWPDHVHHPGDADDVGLQGEREHHHENRGEPGVAAANEPPEDGERPGDEEKTTDEAGVDAELGVRGLA